MTLRFLIASMLFCSWASLSCGQTPTASAWPFSSSPVTTARAAASTPPPRNPPLQERRWEQLAERNVSVAGSEALALTPEQWKHAETENFILHFRRIADANAVAAEIEFDLWFVAKQLGASKEQYAQKSHVYVFKDDREWQKFLEIMGQPKWVSSFAARDELFLNVAEGGGAIDSESLAHEATHAVVARLYGSRRWPIWLNEGFAEYMGRAQFVELVLQGETAQLALPAVYGADFNDMPAFERKFAHFVR